MSHGGQFGSGRARQEDFQLAVSGTSRYSSPVSEMQWRDIWSIIGRRKWTVAFWMLLGLCLAFALTYFSPPKFEAQAILQVEARTQTSAGVVMDPVLSQVLAETSDDDIFTQVSTIRSPEIYSRILAQAGFRGTPTSAADLDANFPMLKVEQDSTSKTIIATVTHKDEEETKRFAEALPKVYQDFLDQRQKDKIDAARSLVRARLSAAEQRINKTIARLAAIQKEEQVASAQEAATLRASQEQNAINELAAAEADLAGLQETLTVQNSQLSAIPARKTETITQTNRDQIEGEKSTLRRLKQQREGLLARFAADHPQVKAIDRVIADQEQVLSDLDKNSVITVERINPEWELHQDKIRTTQAQIRAAEAKVARYESLVTQRRGEVADISASLEERAKLEEQLDGDRRTRTDLLGLDNSLTLKDNQIVSPVRNLNPRPMVDQTGPRWTVNLVLGLALGLMVGILAAILREVTLDQVNYPADAVNIAGADILARIPIRPKSRPPLIDDPQTARAFEAYRLLRAGLVMKMQQAGSGALMVTSTDKGEGKTVVAGNLARAMALDGKTVCVVDCNLRSPKAHRLFKMEMDQGLSDVLMGSVSLEAACRETSIPLLALLSAGTELVNPTEALASPNMQATVEQLQASFDVVILDGPDAYSVADGQELARFVRSVLFVVEVNQTNKSRMEQAIGFLRQAGARIIGVAYNKDPQARGRIGG